MLHFLLRDRKGIFSTAWKKKTGKGHKYHLALMLNMPFKNVSSACLAIIPQRIDIYVNLWIILLPLVSLCRSGIVLRFSGKSLQNRNRWSVKHTDQLLLSESADALVRCKMQYMLLSWGNWIWKVGRQNGSHQKWKRRWWTVNYARFHQKDWQKKRKWKNVTAIIL